MKSYTEKVSITYEVDADVQESTFQNATLQGCMTGDGYVDLSIAVYVDPPDMLDEKALGEWIANALNSLPDGFTADILISDPEEV